VFLCNLLLPFVLFFSTLQCLFFLPFSPFFFRSPPFPSTPPTTTLLWVVSRLSQIHLFFPLSRLSSFRKTHTPLFPNSFRNKENSLFGLPQCYQRNSGGLFSFPLFLNTCLLTPLHSMIKEILILRLIIFFSTPSHTL